MTWDKKHKQAKTWYTTQSIHRNSVMKTWKYKTTTWNSGQTRPTTKISMVSRLVSLAIHSKITRKVVIIFKGIWLVIWNMLGFMIIKYPIFRFKIVRIVIMIISSKSKQNSLRLFSIFMKIIVGILAWEGLRLRLCKFRILIKHNNCRWKNGFKVYVILKKL